MQAIAWKDVYVEEHRQRQYFDMVALEDLATSIDELGIIHPPVLRLDVAQDRFVLVAGERRWRAMGLLLEMGKTIRHGKTAFSQNHIPFLFIGDLNDVKAFEVELAENIERVDLSWQERAKAEARLHEIRGIQNAAQGLSPQTITATATEILQRATPDAGVAAGTALTSIATRIRLADHLADPDVASAKTEKEAVKIVRQKQQVAQNAVLAAAFEADTLKESPHKLLVGRMEDLFPSVASSSVDVLLTDPPYGIDADSFGEQAGQGHNYSDSEEYFEGLMATLAEESFRVCKPESHAYVFCDPRRFTSIQTHFELAGWKVWPIPLIWAKGNGMLPRPEHAPRRTYESILFATKGERIVRAVRADVISIPAIRNLLHGAQKPVELFADLLSRSIRPADTVLDPFAGSGTIFPAANRMKVKAIGFELSPEYANVARLRMDALEDDSSAIPNLDGE